MPARHSHRIVPADAHSVPPPFRSFAVRSEEGLHERDARAPYGRVHVVGTCFLDAEARARLAAAGYARVDIDAFSDVDYAPTTFAELAALAPGAADLPGEIARALHETGVLGAADDGLAACRRSVETRVDFLASRGAGFHNDVRGHWTRCLFWNLALDVADVEFVMPHAAVRVPLAAGDLIVFDPTMAHGLCRPCDAGQAVAASFESGDDGRQLFLTGEILLPEARWAALGAPWLPVEQHEQRGALDLMAAEFDERTGAVKRPRTLAGCMRRDVSYVDHAAGPAEGAPGG